MNIGWFLFVEGAVIRKQWGDQSLEFRIRAIDLLNEIGVKRSKGLQVKVSAADLTNEVIENIQKVCEAYKGDVPLFLKISDGGDVNLELLSRKYRISPVNDMVKMMRKVADVDVVFQFRGRAFFCVGPTPCARTSIAKPSSLNLFLLAAVD